MRARPPRPLAPRIGSGRLAVVLPREGYFQIGYLGRKGTDASLRARGVEAFRRDIAELIPEFADRVDAVQTMDDVRFLDVRLNRLDRWYTDGLLCIGDAAHAMSPMGGVGINLAIQDAVATATLLAEPLLRGTLTGVDLAAVPRRRLLPTSWSRACSGSCIAFSSTRSSRGGARDHHAWSSR